MSDQGLHLSADVAVADWLKPRLRPFASAVAAVVPDGFPAYVRIQHPAPGDGSDPPLGDLPAELLHILYATLAAHTSTEAMCYFCLWDGYGWLHGSSAVQILTRRSGPDDVPPPHPPRAIPPAVSPERLHGLRARRRGFHFGPCVYAHQLSRERMHGPKVRLPNRDYLLFTGPLEAAAELGATIGGTFWPQSPNLFWPRDHAWCVASEIDFWYTLVAGSEPLAEALVADPRLQTSRVNSGDSLS
jgi:hypothetical protein